MENTIEKDIAAAEKSSLDTAPSALTESEEAADKKLALLETLWFGLDYGSILTAYSLVQTVEQLGWKAVLMNKPPKLWTDHYSDPENIAGKFIYKYCPVEKVCESYIDLFEITLPADAVIVGSDILWSYNVCTKQTQNHYFLDYVPDDKLKISYGTSFGYQFIDPYRERAKSCARFLRSFDGLSVGSYQSHDLLEERFGLDSEIVIDPVFLCNPEKFEAIAAEAPCRMDEIDNTFIFNYIKSGTKRKREFLMRGNEILTPNHYSPMRNFININLFPESKKALGLEVAYHITVPDWLFVVTDDFYGVCFAIIFNKPFIFLESEGFDGMENVRSFLCSLGLEERIVYLEDDFKKKEYLFRMPVRYKKVNKLLSALKEQSLGWLKQQLEKEKAVDDDLDSFIEQEEIN